MNRQDLLNLDVNKLFEDRGIDEIIEIEKHLDAELEKKRNDLRSMVGDRYKDILAASDAIKSMKTYSEEIVADIEDIMNTCEKLLDKPDPLLPAAPMDPEILSQKNEERALLIQVRLALFLNEQIWIALDRDQNLEAAQYYLLAQHIYMGLNLNKKDYLDHLVILKQAKLNLSTLKSKIINKVTEKLESVEITAEETSRNLNVLILLNCQTHNQLLSVFIDHRKTALNTVINSHYSSVRMQIAAMVKCIITTLLLLHDCFIYNDSKNGLLWEELDNIISDNALPTISKVQLPKTPLIAYIPDIIKEFRPKLHVTHDQNMIVDDEVINNWLKSTQLNVHEGLENSLQHVTTVKGLYLIEEEALKIVPMESWLKLCSDLNLPENFNVWYFFFQDSITASVKRLISGTVHGSLHTIEKEIKLYLKENSKFEVDLRRYAWKEDGQDVSKSKNDHAGLTMKSLGYSKNVVDLCDKLDKEFQQLLEDVSHYLYGHKYNSENSVQYLMADFKFKRKFIDREALESHLMSESFKNSFRIPKFIRRQIESLPKERQVEHSIFFARFLQASLTLCKNFQKCCDFKNTGVEWINVSTCFNLESLNLWSNWVEDCLQTTIKQANSLSDITAENMASILTKWDEIEIQEQTEEKVFKSQIKLPRKPSITLTELLVHLNNQLSKILPYTLPKSIHVKFIERNVQAILKQYETIALSELNQIQALQFLLDVRFLTTLSVPRDNTLLVNQAQSICDQLRGKIDPFDLDVFYSHLQNNIRKAVSQSQVLYGCLLPSSAQLMNLGAFERGKEQDGSPTLIALSTPSTNSWFPLLPIISSSQKTFGTTQNKVETPKPAVEVDIKASPKKMKDPSSMRQSAVSLFGNFSTDWFS
ncbi:hypothetical protein ABEB36_006943 [Hypothenemus hampei]|uniref:Conserved oligomeric Golgi complex subunit 1 n=1 Tax=Hypothenemus hampei TaxID=57062 RepID=A0ABD1ES87_HYPHA